MSTATGTVSPTGPLDQEHPLLEPSDRMFFVGLWTVGLSLLSALVTFLILTGLTPIVPSNSVVLGALFFNVVLIVAVIAIIAIQVSGLVKAWREKIPGARFHIRIVALFSIIAALPALLVAIGATVSFSRSLDNWFSGRVRTIIENSTVVARTYLEEHGQVIRTDVVNMARDLNAASSLVGGDDKMMKNIIMSQAGLRDLPAAYLIDNNGNVLLRAVEDEHLPFARPTQAALNEARAGQIPLSLSTRDNRISAISSLAEYPGKFLYVSRAVSPAVLRHMQRTEQNAAEYDALRRARGGLKWAHGLMYFMISMTGLLAAIWAGMWFGGRFVAPVRRLIGAAQQISAGNLSVALPEIRGEGDLRRLSHTFNTMSRELKLQRDALVSANEQLEDRRRFMSAVLSGVSAGVIGLDGQERITLVSRAAEDLLGHTGDELVGKNLGEVLPELALFHQKSAEPGIKSRPQEQLAMTVDGDERTFAVRVTFEKAGEDDVGSVITFDDISELVTAQRTSAWADVARRIAHEIKNPLTPIQLSAERLRRKYAKTIEHDRETFEKLTATIERQASHIKDMVDEFAAFARIPKPEMATTDLREAVQDSVVLFREAHTALDYILDMPAQKVLTSIDRRLITQAVTNLVKNATESVESAAEAGGLPKNWKGRVITRIRPDGHRVFVEVIDNGQGMPKQHRSRLLEPYVTTKGHKGTGLGLAMVLKITEQHGGTLTLEDAPVEGGETPRGALVRITLPLKAADVSSPGGEQPDAGKPATSKEFTQSTT
ncbi:MAG: PAS domain-containing sensor histidine kinase [Alphaproteobacteria bacterium BRH_c36]|nr:MAG: PAS domain-containing sensor histidine kinase [Alphaproteobacteria bacterium BRH_c36]